MVANPLGQVGPASLWGGIRDGCQTPVGDEGWQPILHNSGSLPPPPMGALQGVRCVETSNAVGALQGAPKTGFNNRGRG